jgi:hypothetical protein
LTYPTWGANFALAGVTSRQQSTDPTPMFFLVAVSAAAAFPCSP